MIQPPPSRVGKVQWVREGKGLEEMGGREEGVLCFSFLVVQRTTLNCKKTKTLVWSEQPCFKKQHPAQAQDQVVIYLYLGAACVLASAHRQWPLGEIPPQWDLQGYRSVLKQMPFSGHL